jgi:uncharacterized protein YcgI (DUF1989 family)
VLKRGTALRITSLADHANVGAMFLNADNTSERLNLPDTLKAQHIARLTTGAVLYSDMARILCSITDDTLGWHDPLADVPMRRWLRQSLGRWTIRRLATTGTRMRSMDS